MSRCLPADVAQGIFAGRKVCHYEKAVTCFLSVILLFPSFFVPVYAENPQMELSAKSAVLLEPTTGKILFEKSSHDKLPPASVTKIMTMLLVMEALDNGQCKLEDMVRTSALAASMGGSQVFWKKMKK